jgi:hypothetical protein
MNPLQLGEKDVSFGGYNNGDRIGYLLEHHQSLNYQFFAIRKRDD